MKLLEAYRLSRAPQNPEAPGFSAGLACGFTPLHLHTFLHAHLKQRLPRHAVAVHTGLYGDLLGAVRKFGSDGIDAVFVALEWPDLDGRLGIRGNGQWTTSYLQEILQRADLFLKALQNEALTLAQQTQITLSLPTLPLLPISHTRAIEASLFEIELRQLLWRFAGAVGVSERIVLIGPDELDRVSPPSSRHDPPAELNNGFPYKLEFADIMAQTAAKLLVPETPKKGLITDLDDTLWRGLLGEEEVGGVHWDLDHGSQIHALYQNVLSSLAESGVLIAIASKNDEARVQQALQREDLILRPNQVFPVEAHWKPKSTSVSRILASWNIAADSVVFVDDSPIELAEVQAAHPQIECMLFPKDDPAKALELFYGLRDRFGKRQIAEEDRLRLSSIRSAVELRTAGLPADTAEDLLRSADSRAVLLWNNEQAFNRALELVNKTNQFNLNGIRHTEVSLRQYLMPPSRHLLVADYEDRFGKLGKIAVLAGKLSGEELQVDSWVMSCRAFARRIEYFCLQAVFRELNVNTIVFQFQETGRNGPMREFLESLNAGPLTESVKISRDVFEKQLPTLYIQAV